MTTPLSLKYTTGHMATIAQAFALLKKGEKFSAIVDAGSYEDARRGDKLFGTGELIDTKDTNLPEDEKGYDRGQRLGEQVDVVGEESDHDSADGEDVDYRTSC